jgi:hypothetical protein
MAGFADATRVPRWLVRLVARELTVWSSGAARPGTASAVAGTGQVDGYCASPGRVIHRGRASVRVAIAMTVVAALRLHARQGQGGP